MAHVEYRCTVDVPAAELFAWHARPGAFERLVPPWDDVRVVERHGSIRDGDTLRMALRQGPLSLTWLARHEGFVEGRVFVDVQERGPFAAWRHVHECLPHGPHRSLLADRITYRLPLAPVSHWVAGWAVRRTLDRMFRFRHDRTVRDLAQHARYLGQPRLTVGLPPECTDLLATVAAILSTGGHTAVQVVGRGAEPMVCSPFDPSMQLRACPRLDVVVLPADAPVPTWATSARHVVRIAPSGSTDWRIRDDAAWQTCHAVLQTGGLRPVG